METSSGIQYALEFYRTLLKLLERAAVQRQVVAALVAVLVAWALSQLIERWLKRHYRAWRGRSDAADQPSRTKTQRLIDIVYEIGRQLILPVSVLLLFVVAIALFDQAQWFSGLLSRLLNVIEVFLVYRLLIGMMYAFGERQVVRRYHQRLLTPLIITVMTLWVIGCFVDVNTLINAPLFPVFDSTITLGGLILATVGLYLWIVATGACQEVVEWVLTSRKMGNVGSIHAGTTLMRYGFIAVGLFVAFHIIGLNGTTVAAITGGLSIGVGIALQDVIKNFLGGIILLFEGTVRPGDWVAFSGTEGEVAKLSIRSTLVRTPDNIEYIVPNQDWLNSVVTTYTRTDRRVRVRIPIGVSYDSDMRAVQQLLIDVGLQHPLVLKNPPPAAALLDFADSSVNFALMVWVDETTTKGKVAGDLRFMIWDAFKAHNIEIPYPQQDVHIRSTVPFLPAATANGQSNGESSVLAVKA